MNKITIVAGLAFFSIIGCTPTTHSDDTSPNHTVTLSTDIVNPSSATITKEAIRLYYPLMFKLERADFSIFGAESKKGTHISCDDTHNVTTLISCLKDDIASIHNAGVVIPAANYSDPCAVQISHRAAWYIQGREPYLQSMVNYLTTNKASLLKEKDFDFSEASNRFKYTVAYPYNDTDTAMQDMWAGHPVPEFSEAIYSLKCLGNLFTVKNRSGYAQDATYLTMMAKGLHVDGARDSASNGWVVLDK
jgi:hypothetical protein